jgi:hypothetical protein
MTTWPWHLPDSGGAVSVPVDDPEYQVAGALLRLKSSCVDIEVPIRLSMSATAILSQSYTGEPPVMERWLSVMTKIDPVQREATPMITLGVKYPSEKYRNPNKVRPRQIMMVSVIAGGLQQLQ